MKHIRQMTCRSHKKQTKSTDKVGRYSDRCKHLPNGDAGAHHKAECQHRGDDLHLQNDALPSRLHSEHWRACTMQLQIESRTVHKESKRRDQVEQRVKHNDGGFDQIVELWHFVMMRIKQSKVQNVLSCWMSIVNNDLLSIHQHNNGQPNHYGNGVAHRSQRPNFQWRIFQILFVCCVIQFNPQKQNDHVAKEEKKGRSWIDGMTWIKKWFQSIESKLNYRNWAKTWRDLGFSTWLLTKWIEFSARDTSASGNIDSIKPNINNSV